MRLLLILCAMMSPVASANGLDMYLNIYESSLAKLSETEEGEEIIYSRIESRIYPTIDRRLTDEEERALIETGVTTALQNNVDQSAVLVEIREKYDFEKAMYLLEKKMVDDLAALSSFSNEAESDAGFDLVADLNVIDEILFGSKAKKTNPSFAEEDSGLSTAKEEWQTGDPRTAGEGDGGAINSGEITDEFSDSEKSISAAIESLMSYTEELNGKPLNGEFPTDKFFQTGQTIAEIASRIGLTQRSQTTPQESGEAPEVDEDICGIRDQIEPMLTSVVVTSDREYYSNLYTTEAAYDSTDIQDSLSNSRFNTQVHGITRGGQVCQQDQNLSVQDKILEHLGLEFNSFKTQLLEIQETLENFYPSEKDRR